MDLLLAPPFMTLLFEGRLKIRGLIIPDMGLRKRKSFTELVVVGFFLFVSLTSLEMKTLRFLLLKKVMILVGRSLRQLVELITFLSKRNSYL